MSSRVDSTLVHRVVSACRSEGLNETARRLEAQLAALENDAHEVFVIGRSRVGKSSVINSLLGARVVPTDVVPCTSVLVDVSAGASFAVTIDLPGGRRSVPADELASYISEEQNPANIRQVGRIAIHHPSPVLAAGLHLFDTPGTESLNALHDRILLDHLHRADCAIFVYRAPMLVPGPHEVDLLRRIQEVSGRLIVIQNDQAGTGPDAGNQIAELVQSQLRDHDIRVDRFARLCTTNPEREHLDAVRALVRDATEAATSIKYRALARRSRLAGRTCIARMTEKVDASTAPISELRARLDARTTTLHHMRTRANLVRASWALRIGSFTDALEGYLSTLKPSVLGGEVGSLLAPDGAVLAGDLEAAVNVELLRWYQGLEALGITAKNDLKGELLKHQVGTEAELFDDGEVEFVAAFDGLSSIGSRRWEVPGESDEPLANIGDRIATLSRSLSAKQRAKLRRELEGDVAQLHGQIKKQLDAMLTQLRAELEGYLHDTVDARIELLDTVVRSLIRDREDAHPRVQASVTALRNQQASLTATLRALEKPAR